MYKIAVYTLVNGNYSYSGEWCSSAFYRPTTYWIYTCIWKRWCKRTP